MTVIWGKLFKRGIYRGSQQDASQEPEATKARWRFARWFGSSSNEQEALESPTTVINCTERMHYPLYDPNNPTHNPRARRHGRLRSSTTKTSPSNSESLSTKSIRRAGSTIAALAQSIRSKRTSRRPPIPTEKEMPSALPGEALLDHSNGKTRHLPKGSFARAGLDGLTTDSLGSKAVNTGTSLQPSAPSQTPGAGFLGDLAGLGSNTAGATGFMEGYTAEEFVRSKYFASPNLEHVAGVTQDETNRLCPTGDTSVNGLLPIAVGWSTTPPPNYSPCDEGYEADEETAPDPPVVTARSAGASHTLPVNTDTSTGGLEAGSHHEAARADDLSVHHRLRRSESVKSLYREPTLLAADASNDASPTTKSTIQLSPEKYEPISERSESSQSIAPSNQWLDVPKQRSSPLCRKAPSEAATEIDSDFGVEIYRTTRHGDRHQMTDRNSSLQCALSSSTAPSEMDRQSRASDNFSPDHHCHVQIDQEVGETLVVANYPGSVSAAARLPVECGEKGSTESISLDLCGIPSQDQFELEQLSCDSDSEASRSSCTFVEMPAYDSAIGERLSSRVSSNHMASGTVPQSQGALRHAVEAIDRLSGHELPETEVQVPFPLPYQNQNRNWQLRQTLGQSQEDSSSGSNETGQSDPASSVAAATAYSSTSSECDCFPAFVEEGADKHAKNNPLKPENTQLETAPPN